MRDSETTSRVEPFMFIRFPARSPDVAVFSGALSVPALQTAGGTGLAIRHFIEPVANDSRPVLGFLGLMLDQVETLKLSNSFTQTADAQSVERFKLRNPVVGFEVGQELGVLGHYRALPFSQCEMICPTR